MGVQRILKAVYGAVSAALAATGAAYVQGAGHIGWAAGIVIGGAFWGALGIIWGVPNSNPAAGAGEDAGP